ncbi:putative dsRNA-binding protein [Nonomuraea sp. NPDC050680]|uniref:putative dsRNA-binding protein n=1 Tax=Nonomuraea sp. NPDC050680 TaxID=3154630 RepID=UPI003400F698
MQELAARQGLGAPEYEVSAREPEGFLAWVALGGKIHGRGLGLSKKEAQQHAAKAAFAQLSGEG